MTTGRERERNNPELTKRFYWHPDCWVKQGLDKLHMDGYCSTETYRALNELTPEQKKLRSVLQRKWHTSLSRLSNALEDGKIDVSIRLVERMEKIKKDITDCGGVPKKWWKELQIDTTKVEDMQREMQ